MPSTARSCSPSCPCWKDPPPPVPPASRRWSSGGRSTSALPGDAEVDAFERAIRDAGVAADRTELRRRRHARRRPRPGVLAATIAGVPRQHRGHAGDRRTARLPRLQRVVRQPRRRCRARPPRTTWPPRTSPWPPPRPARSAATVLVEPVSGADRYPLLTAADAVDVITRVERESGVTSVGLLADLYHLTVNGDDVGKAITTYADRIAHVQIADAPGRNEPGTGDDPDRPVSRGVCGPPGTTAGSGWSTSPSTHERRELRLDRTDRSARTEKELACHE